MISLNVENLSKKFNQHVIFQALSFVHSDGVLGISGANGSGKSTLLKCLAFLLRPQTGKVNWTFWGKNPDQQQIKSIMGYCAPYINLYAELTVLENLCFLMDVGGYSADVNQVKKLLERVQIPHLQDQLFGSLSTGQQQRAKLASALVRNPQILLLDEPGSNLDDKGHQLVVDIVEEAKLNDKLIIIASNDPNEINLCDEVVGLNSL